MSGHTDWYRRFNTQRADRLNSGNVFQHVNSKLYRIITVIWDSENECEAVLHESVESKRQYVRSVENFLGLHKTGIKRFAFWDTAHGMLGED